MAATHRTTVTANSATINKPSGLSDGDLMLAFAYRNSTSLASLPSGWTQLTSKSAYSSVSLNVGYLQVGTASSEPSSYTFTSASNVIIVVVYGHNKLSPFLSTEAQATPFSASISLTFSAYTRVSGRLALASIGSNSTNGFNSTSVPTGYTHGAAGDRTKAAYRAEVDGTQGQYSYTWGSNSQQLAGARTIIDSGVYGTVSAETSSASASAIAPSILVSSSVTPEAASGLAQLVAPTISTGSDVLVAPSVATASSNLSIPDTFGAAIIASDTASSLSSALSPSVAGAAFAIPDASTALGTGNPASVVTGALQLATTLTATGEALAPAVSGGALVVADSQNAFCLSVSPAITGGATVAIATSSASSDAATPLVMQSITVPLFAATTAVAAPSAFVSMLIMAEVLSAASSSLAPTPAWSISAPSASSSAQAPAAAALGSAILRPLPGSLISSAVAPGAGIDKRSGAWGNRRISVEITATSAMAAAAESPSATYNQSRVRGVQSSRSAVAVTQSQSSVLASQERRENE